MHKDKILNIFVSLPAGPLISDHDHYQLGLLINSIRVHTKVVQLLFH